jgi:putative tryptophan/tyrosine transport system substrate-binding protein
LNEAPQVHHAARRRGSVAADGACAAARWQSRPNWISSASLEDPFTGPAYPDFLDELKKSGFSEGQNLEIEAVNIQQDAQRLFTETANLVQSKVELLVATGPEIVLKAAIAASQTIPIVMWAVNFDPIARGYVKSLARPGGNITGGRISANRIGRKTSRALD